MFDKLNQLNKSLNIWWEKKQRELTKAQHLILVIVCTSYFILSVGFTGGMEKTILNYYLPFFCFVTMGGSFSLNAIFHKKYKIK